MRGPMSFQISDLSSRVGGMTEVAWGPNLRFFYNDAYRPTLEVKHSRALGALSRDGPATERERTSLRRKGCSRTGRCGHSLHSRSPSDRKAEPSHHSWGSMPAAGSPGAIRP